jgi:hypothetical protein
MIRASRWRPFRQNGPTDPDKRPPTFIIAEGAEVLLVTHILELPLDLGLPEGRMVLISEERTDVFQSWTPEAIAIAFQLPRTLTAGTFPVVRLSFRRRYLPERAELFTALESFSDWFYPYAPTDARRTHEMLRKGFKRGSWGWISAVGATTFLPVSAWPADPVEQARTTGVELDKAITILNEFLISLSLARSEPAIHPIGRGDLPRLCPVILETVPMPSGTRNATAYPYQIHQIDRHRYGPRDARDELQPEEQFAFDLFVSSHLEGQPFFLFYELMQSAIGSFNEGRFRMCLASTGSAFEVLVQIVIRETSPLHGYNQSRIDGILDAGLRNQLEIHIPRLTGCVVDLDDTSNDFGAWWQDGYKNRNLVIHRGATPTREQARSALGQANGVAAALRAGLLNQPVTSDVEQAFLWGGTAPKA